MSLIDNMTDIKDITKKTQNIVTTIYMVCEYIDEKDPIKEKLKGLSLSLITQVVDYDYNVIALGHSHVKSLLTTSEQICSLIKIAETIGLVSKMNATIILSELSKINNHLSETASTSERKESLTISSVVFPKDLFSDDDARDQQKKNVNKTTQHNVANSHISLPLKNIQRHTPSTPTIFIGKEDRKKKILEIVREKGIDNGVVIKDICNVMPTLSEKTIQRELTDMVDSGVLKKVGEKRWSRYHLVLNQNS